MMCPDVIATKIGIQPTNATNTTNNARNTNLVETKNTALDNTGKAATVRGHKQQTCQRWAVRWFDWWNKKMKDMLKVITFLVGFYVSTIATRWWEQIKEIPTPARINIQLANVVKKMSDEQALSFKKKIMRYVHLSWTLVMTQRNKNLFRLYSEKKELKAKGLLTEDEVKNLELGMKECEATSYQSLWWEPLNWATIMIKKAKNAGQLGDPKDLLKDIRLFQVELGHILRHKHNKLPVIFSQAVWVAVIVWMFVTLIGAQNTDHNSEVQARAHNPVRETLLTLPGHELFAVILIITWLQAADKLYNPFQNNKGFSVNLEEELDYSLWRSSKLLQHSDLASKKGEIDFLEF